MELKLLRLKTISQEDIDDIKTSFSDEYEEEVIDSSFTKNYIELKVKNIFSDEAKDKIKKNWYEVWNSEQKDCKLCGCDLEKQYPLPKSMMIENGTLSIEVSDNYYCSWDCMINDLDFYNYSFTLKLSLFKIIEYLQKIID